MPEGRGTQPRSLVGEGPMCKHCLVVRVVGLAMLACLMIVSLRSVRVHPAGVGAGAGALQRPSSAGWSTRGADILTPAGGPFVIAGVSWYGIETPQYVPYGLDVQDYK